MRLLLATFLPVVLLAVPAAAQDNPWLERRVLDIAHRGGEDEYPTNTSYAFRQAVRAGADMLELDVGGDEGRPGGRHARHLRRPHDERPALVSRNTLEQVRRLDAAHWLAPRRAGHYGHDHPRRAYRFRGIATGNGKPPKGFARGDFRVPTLDEVLKGSRRSRPTSR